jgi:hypothetical protein
MVWNVRRSNIYEKQSNECVIEQMKQIMIFFFNVTLWPPTINNNIY